MRLKKPVPFVVAAVLLLGTAAAFTACDQPDKYADLVAVRINGRMAEWTDTAYNFKYEGDSTLNVSVPYTNYLEITDLIVSPEAEGKVYSDSNYTQEITDTEKIHTDGDTSLYIRVTKGKTSHDYMVNVDVSEENLPEGDLSAKDYDNRGGHVYIPENAETVTVDGVEFEVLRGIETTYYYNPYFRGPIIEKGKNYILANDIYYYQEDSNYFEESGFYEFSNIFDGNGYTVTYTPKSSRLVYTLTENGVIRNMVMERMQTIGGLFCPIMNEFSFIAYCNKGLIDNVVFNGNHEISRVDTIYPKSEKDGYKLVKAAQFVSKNEGGTIQNCINYGDLTNALDEKYCIEMGAFATYANSGTIRNCVNTGTLGGRPQDMESPNGNFIISYSAGKDLKIEGVYNLGKTEVAEEWKEYDSFFAVREGGASVDTTQTRNYVN